MKATGRWIKVLTLLSRLVSRGAAPEAFWIMALSITLRHKNGTWLRTGWEHLEWQSVTFKMYTPCSS